MLTTKEVSKKVSKELYEKSKKTMPGGVTANIKYFSPHPIMMKSGRGAYLTDVDGNEYIDYLLSYSALMLGHGHPKIQEAMTNQIDDNGSWLLGAPHEREVIFGERIKQYFPSIDLLRYTNSGTEATLLALRLAASYTGKYKIAKFEGHYHGGYDQVLLSTEPPVDEAGPESCPVAVPASKAVDPYYKERTIVLPFNRESTFDILKKHHHDIGAIVIEPTQGGFIPAEQEFMEKLRKVTEELNIVLIFDEVKTGFRTCLGGVQNLYGIQPDLTALGKVIGGGFPFGVVGGKEEILMESAPVEGTSNKLLHQKDVLFHSGTYNGHPLILATGLATLDVLDDELSHVLEMSDRLKASLEALFYQKGIPMQALGLGSMFNIVLTDEKITSYRDLQVSDFDLRRKIDLQLLDQGIYGKPLNRYSLSTCHGEKEIERTLEAFDKVLRLL